MNPLRAGRLWVVGLVVGLSLIAAVALGSGAVLGGFVLGAGVGWANLEGIAWLVRRALGGSGHRGLVLLLLPVKLVLVVLVAVFALRLLGLSRGAFAVGVATALLAALLGGRTGAAARGRNA